MFGHGRVLPPDWRDPSNARDCSRLLLTKAARRMRREGFYANSLHLWLGLRIKRNENLGWQTRGKLNEANDDQACLKLLDRLWEEARFVLPKNIRVVRVHVTFGDLTPSNSRQLDMLISDDPERLKWESATTAMDSLNKRYGKSLVTMGKWSPPPGGYAGGKISYTRIPKAEDFW